MLLVLLAPVIAFYAWRLWLRMHGKTWKPEGELEPRLQAMHDYADRLPKLTRREQIRRAVTVLIIVLVEGSIVALLVHRSH